ncbi:MAG: hypothetical protein GY820_38980 [Gammaproteobacteria bacterium]|nr:hypothetical protein [Gammaproteobacteria bacterium]
MSKKIKLGKITIKMKGGKDVELELSIEDAKELHRQLDELFGTQPFIPYYPIYIERDRVLPCNQPWITYGEETSTGESVTFDHSFETSDNRFKTSDNPHTTYGWGQV